MKLGINLTALALALCIFMQFMPVVTFAATKESLPELTVTQAANKAISHNNTIKNTSESIALSDEDIRKAQDSLNSATTDTAILNAQVSLMNTEMNRALNIENIEAQKENVEYNIMKYFNTIINAEKNAEIYDESLKIQKKKLEISEVKLGLGKLSQADYNTELATYKNNLTSRQTYQSAIEKAYRDLNSYMGEDLDKKYTLVLELKYKPVGEISLNSYADTFISKSLSVTQAENSLKVAKYKMDNYTEPYDINTGVISDSYGEYDQLVVNYNQAVRSLADTKENIRQNIVSSYSSLKDLEITIEGKIADIEQANEKLKILEAKLALGKATRLEVDEQLYSIASKEESLRQAKNSYALSVISFSSPNLLSAVQ